MVRATGGVAPVLVPTEVNQPWARPSVGSKGRYESTMVSPGAEKRECCPYLFQRGMLVSDEGVRGGQDHLRSDEVRRVAVCFFCVLVGCFDGICLSLLF